MFSLLFERTALFGSDLREPHGRRLDEPRAQRVDPDPARRKLHGHRARTAAGPLVHRESTAHSINVLASAPVRVACNGGKVRSVRERGEINVIPAGLSDEWFEDDASESVELRLPHALVHRAAEDMGLDPSRARIEPRYHLRDVQIEHIAWALQAEARAGFPSGLVYTESLGLALTVHLLSRYSPPLAARRGLSDAQMRRVRDYIEAHLPNAISLFTLARLCGMSSSHFRAQFKRSMGVPVHQYVTQRRVEYARALLARGELPASEVALAAGFAHQSHLARAMRRMLGVTPGALRQRG